MNLKELGKKLRSKLGLHMVGLLLVIGGTAYIINHKDIEYRSDRDLIIQLYMKQIHDKDSIYTELKLEQKTLEVKLDSLEKVKQQILIKHDQEINIIHDASAANHAKWLDSIINNLEN
jgi:hypothetical protein